MNSFALAALQRADVGAALMDRMGEGLSGVGSIDVDLLNHSLRDTNQVLQPLATLVVKFRAERATGPVELRHKNWKGMPVAFGEGTTGFGETTLAVTEREPGGLHGSFSFLDPKSQSLHTVRFGDNPSADDVAGYVAKRSDVRSQPEAPEVPGFVLANPPLGRGGFGEVYRACDRAGVERAIKLFAPSALAPQANALDRFKREAHALTVLNHPNIVKYLQLAEGSSGWYLVMELVRGQRLDVWARDQSYIARAEAILQVLDGLEHMHALGIFHRDLKPSNILVEATTNRVVIVDLGLTWMVERGDDTITRGSAWSPSHAPPESVADPSESRSPKHDIYSMGVNGGRFPS